MRQQAAGERLLAGPDDVGDEIGEAERRELGAHARVVGGVIAGQDEQLLDVAMGRVIEQREHLVRLVQVGLVGREGAVLAV